MMTKVQGGLILTALLLAASPAHAQGRPSVPFHVSAISGGSDETLTAVFSEPVPAGKRLLVRHVSLHVVALDAIEEMVLANCMITGRGLGTGGNSQAVQHFIPLTSRANLAARKESLTGGGALAMRLEAGPIDVTCSSGADGQNLTVLQAHLSGDLVSK